MKNEHYAALLEDNERTPEERMKAIVFIIQKQLEDMTSGLAKDISLLGEVLEKSLKKYANDKFHSMKTGFEKEHILYVELFLDEGDGEKQWRPVVTFKKAGYFERMFMNENYVTRHVDRPSSWEMHADLDGDYVNSSHAYRGVTESINAINWNVQLDDRHISIGTGDRITAGTIDTRHIRAEAIDAGHVGAMTMNNATFANADRWVDALRDAPVHVVRESPTVEFIERPDQVANFGPMRTPWPAVLTEGSFVGEAMDVELGELREATWNARSVTEDMRELNHSRLIREVERGLQRIIEGYRSPMDGAVRVEEAQLIETVEHFLQGFQRAGRITDYGFEHFQANPSGYGMPTRTMTVRVRLPQSVEDINIAVTIVP